LFAQIVLVSDEEELQDRHECQQYLGLAHLVAFEFAEGTVRTFQIAFAGAWDDDDIVASRCTRLMKHEPVLARSAE
jgi:hypothetical protein